MKGYIGIDLGGTNIKAGVVDQDGKILCKHSVKTGAKRTMEEIVRDMGQLALDVAAQSGLNVDDILAVGIGSPGTPNNQKGTLVYSSNLPFRDAPLREIIGEMIQKPVYIENDANCAAMAESVAGAAKEAAHSVTVTLGTGVGAGIIINRRIYSGFNQAGSEFGHSVIVVGGVPCGCGRNGCFESYASATGLIRMTKEAAAAHKDSKINQVIAENNGKVNAKIAFQAMRLGDEVAAAVVEQYLEHLSEGLANVINALMPEILVVGGGVCNEGDALLIPVREKVRSKTYYGPGVPKTTIKLAEMGNDAGIIGAAMMAKSCVDDHLAG
ncbi:MAG: ROK family protein [Clostridiaceae bacterium]|nr:ROK family protein [Clostridiaceae bacterium]